MSCLLHKIFFARHNCECSLQLVSFTYNLNCRLLTYFYTTLLEQVTFGIGRMGVLPVSVVIGLPKVTAALVYCLHKYIRQKLSNTKSRAVSRVRKKQEHRSLSLKKHLLTRTPYHPLFLGLFLLLKIGIIEKKLPSRYFVPRSPYNWRQQYSDQGF